MSRITAAELTPQHQGELVTVSAETGESITITLQSIRTDDDRVRLTGKCMGSRRQLVLVSWQPVHVYTPEPVRSAAEDTAAALDAAEERQAEAQARGGAA